MDVVTETQHMALAFVRAANEGGHTPSARQLDAWISQPTSMHTGINWAITHLGAGGVPSEAGRGVAAHLVQLGWLIQVKGEELILSPLGTALLSSAGLSDASSVHAVVLDNDDPLAYPRLIGTLVNIQAEYLVDPYLDVEGAADVISHTDVRRALVSGEERTRRHRAALATYLRAEAASFEVRVAQEGIHDRIVVADEGVWTIGASLNGVMRRKAITVLSPVPEPAAQALREFAEHAWVNALPLTSRDDESTISE